MPRLRSQLALIKLGNDEKVLLISVARSSMLQHVPYCLDTVLTSPYILKAAAEAWKDAQMVFQNLGVRLCGGVCLTAAVAPQFNNTPGLFIMMYYLFPSRGLNKDKRITTSDWFLSIESEAAAIRCPVRFCLLGDSCWQARSGGPGESCPLCDNLFPATQDTNMMLLHGVTEAARCRPAHLKPAALCVKQVRRLLRWRWL